MSKKQKQLYFFAFCSVFLVIAVLLSHSLRRTERVILPEQDMMFANGEEMEESENILLLEVTPETVGQVVASLNRPTGYQRHITTEIFWSGGSDTVTTTVQCNGAWMSFERKQPDGFLRHLITDGNAVYLWYENQQTVYTGKTAEISLTEEQLIPDYQMVIDLLPAEIAEATYLWYEGLRCIYVETKPDALGYTQKLWIDVDTGLLVAAERYIEAVLVQRVSALTVAFPETGEICLPDGTILQS